MSSTGTFKFWDGLYEDIERCILAFFSIQDFYNAFTTNTKFNKMIAKWIYNESNFHQSFDNTVILPAIKQVIVVQYFVMEKKKSAVVIDQVSKEGTEFEFEIRQKFLQKLKEKESEIMGFIKSIVLKNVTISKWFLNYLIDNPMYLEELLFSKSPKRNRFARLIINGLKAIKPFESNVIRQVNVKYRLTTDSYFNSTNNKQYETKNEKKDDNDVNDVNDYGSISSNGNKNQSINDEDDDDDAILSLRLIKLLVTFIQRTLSAGRLREIKSYWCIFEELVMFGIEYRHYLINLQFISILGHLYLYRKSPYTNEMGYKPCTGLAKLFAPRYSSPKIIYLLSILIRSCHSRATSIRYNKAIEMFNNNKQCDKNEKYTNEDKQQLINLFQIPQNSLSYYEKKYSFDDYKCYTLLPLSIKDSRLVNSSVFWNEVILASRVRAEKASYIYGNEILKHWCFNDIKFSRMIIEVLLKKFDAHTSSMTASHVDACFSMMETLILMDEDNLLIERFNMLFNCHGHSVIEGGIEILNLTQDLGIENRYGETIDLINIIESQNQSHAEFSFRCIKEIFDCIKKNKHFGQLMFEIRDNRWKQWDLRIKERCSQEIWNDYSSVIESFGEQT